MPTLFNLVVENVVCNRLSMTLEENLFAQDGLVIEVRKSMEVFHSHDGLVVSWEPECIQGYLNVLIGLFWWYGMVAKVSKSKSMTC